MKNKNVTICSDCGASTYNDYDGEDYHNEWCSRHKGKIAGVVYSEKENKNMNEIVQCTICGQRIGHNEEHRCYGAVPLNPIPNDPINHPLHYTFSKFEVIDVLQDWFANDPLLWQVGKYIARAKHKGKMLEDLKKAEFYLKRRIEMLEKENGN